MRKPSLSTSREHLDPVVPEDDHARLFNGSSYNFAHTGHGSQLLPLVERVMVT